MDVQWFPCAKYIPKKYGRYLACTDKNAIHILYWDVDLAKWITPDGKDVIPERKNGMKVVAWMPLPKPYQESVEQLSLF